MIELINKVLMFMFLYYLFLFLILRFLSLLYYLICLAAPSGKKSCPELPDLTFKGRVNPDTPISQMNGKNITLPL